MILNHQIGYDALLLTFLLFLLERSMCSFYGFEAPSNFLVGRVQKLGKGQLQNGIITYPYTGYSLNTFIGAPDAVVSLASIEWNVRIQYSLKILNVNQSAVYINYTIGSKVSKIAINILFFDTNYWQYSSSVFQRMQPGNTGGDSTTIQLNIIDHQKFYLSYLTAFTAQVQDQEVSLAYSRIAGSSPLFVNFKIFYDKGDLKVQYIQYFMLTFTGGYESPKHYRQSGCIIYGRVANALEFSSQNSQLPTSVTSSSNYFYGIHTIKKFTEAQQRNDIINITTKSVQNSDYLFTSYRIQIRCCQSSNPNYQQNTGTCTSACAVGYYSNQVFYCARCDLRCKTCSGSATSCNSCNANFTYNAATKNCICLGFYNSTNGKCSDCKDHITYCIQCLNETYCTKCQDSFFLVQSLGIGNCQCPSNYIYQIDGSDYCIMGSSAQSCPVGQVVEQNRCVCPSGKRLINQLCL